MNSGGDRRQKAKPKKSENSPVAGLSLLANQWTRGIALLLVFHNQFPAHSIYIHKNAQKVPLSSVIQNPNRVSDLNLLHSCSNLLIQIIYSPQTALPELCWCIKQNNLKVILWFEAVQLSNQKKNHTTPSPPSKTQTTYMWFPEGKPTPSPSPGPRGKVRPNGASQLIKKKKEQPHQKSVPKNPALKSRAGRRWASPHNRKNFCLWKSHPSSGVSNSIDFHLLLVPV